MKVKKDSETFV